MKVVQDIMTKLFPRQEMAAHILTGVTSNANGPEKEACHQINPTKMEEIFSKLYASGWPLHTVSNWNILRPASLLGIHPVIHHEYLEGNFAVQRSHNAFSKVACDQRQSSRRPTNRDNKTKGGMVGFSSSKGAVNRWIWSHQARGFITHECEAMAGRRETNETG